MQGTNNHNTPNSTDISRAKQGHCESLELLIYHFQPALEKHLASSIPAKYSSVLGIDDIVQETTMRSCDKIDGLQADSPHGFFAWLRQIADHVLCSQIRKLESKKRGGEFTKLGGVENSGALDQSPTPQEHVELQEMAVAVKTNVQTLPTTQRKVIRKVLLEAQTVRETAEEMEKTPAVIRGLLKRALKTLKDGMGGSTNWFSRK